MVPFCILPTKFNFRIHVESCSFERFNCPLSHEWPVDFLIGGDYAVAASGATMSIDGATQREREGFRAKFERTDKFAKCIWALPFRGEWRVARHRLWRHVGLHVAIEKGFATLRHILLQNESRTRWRNGPVGGQWTTAPTASTLLLWSAILNVEAERQKKKKISKQNAV